MKWYWRKQARKDVVYPNAVKYTLHDGLMKLAETKPTVEEEPTSDGECEAEEPVTQQYDSTINNLTENLQNAQKSSNYWRAMYNDVRMSGK